MSVKHVGFIYRETFPKDGCDTDWIDREVFVMELEKFGKSSPEEEAEIKEFRERVIKAIRTKEKAAEIHDRLCQRSDCYARPDGSVGHHEQDKARTLKIEKLVDTKPSFYERLDNFGYPWIQIVIGGLVGLYGLVWLVKFFWRHS
jgi:hypothetical protein